MSDFTTLPYMKELTSLAETWKSTLNASERMSDCLAEVAGSSTAYVASGGGLAVAQIAADLHVQRFSSLAIAISPLELSNFGHGSIKSCVIFTARARHFDSSLAVAEATRIRVKNLWVVTLLEKKDIPEDLRAYASIVSLPNNISKDGFLATNSIISFCAALGVAHEQFEGRRLSETLPAFNDDLGLRTPKKHIISLYSPPSLGAVLDFQTRMFETGMAWVQATDARNFAHGRHVGLVENIKTTSVVTFEQPETISIIETTCGHL
jgi:fructoselysine-6-P-deglycase FrlB-like protein